MQKKQSSSSRLPKRKRSPEQVNNINSVLSNILSKNIPNTQHKSKYYKQTKKMYTDFLKKKFKKRFVIHHHEFGEHNTDLLLPVMKHFQLNLRIPEFHSQMVIYQNIRGNNTYKKYYDSLNGTGSFYKQLKNIVDEIATIILFALYDHYDYGKNIQQNEFTLPINEKYIDRYSLKVDIEEKKVVVSLLKIDHIFENVTLNSLNLVDSFQTSLPNKRPLIDNYIKNIKKELLSFLKNTFSVLNDKIPLSYLLVSNKQYHTKKSPPYLQNNHTNLHIEYGYTFVDARRMGLSTILRKLLVFYGSDTNANMISTEAVAGGSQAGSRSAGYSQMPKKKFNKSFFNQVLSAIPENELLNVLFENTPGNKLRKTTYRSTGHLPKKQKQIIERLSLGGNGVPLTYFNHGTSYGTHTFMPQKKQRSIKRIIRQNTTRSKL